MTKYLYPKQPPKLNFEQEHAREELMLRWHETLPKKYSFIESFNHNFPASLPIEKGINTLEVGAGLGEHAKYENVTQNYYCLEYRESFCEKLKKLMPSDKVIHGDIELRQPFEGGFFDRIIAVHVLEHLRNLPSALDEIYRLLSNGGFLDIVIPCEGGFLYSICRCLSAKRLFKKMYPALEYEPIIKNEHVSEYDEIILELKERFQIMKTSLFPFPFLFFKSFNICIGMRLVKK